MRALVTGSRGFVGAHLERHLRAKGDSVVGVDRECDVTDVAAVARQLALSRPEVIYHLAAFSHVGESWKDPALVNRVNVLGTASVLRAARDVVPEATVLVVSSADVYGVVEESDLPLVESRRPVPVSPYAKSKLEAEQVALDAVRSSDQRVVVARPFNHVGPGQSTTFFVPGLADRLLEACEQGRDEVQVGDLSPRRDFSDVRDIVRAYRLLVRFGTIGEVYNVASGRDVALADVANALVSMVMPSAKLVVDPALLRPVEVPVLRGSLNKLHDATGWEPLIPLATSLVDVVDDIRSRR